MLEYLILGLLYNCSLTGYEIKKFIDNGIGISSKSSFGSLYPALKRLAEKGFLSSVAEPCGKRSRIYYKITESGKKELLAWLKKPMQILDGNNYNLVKIYFLDILPLDESREIIEKYEQSNIAYLKELESKEQELQSLPDKKCFYYKLSTLYEGIMMVKANIEWCSHVKANKDLRELL